MVLYVNYFINFITAFSSLGLNDNSELVSCPVMNTLVLEGQFRGCIDFKQMKKTFPKKGQLWWQN